MQGQAWYLTPSFVVMTLTDDDIPEETRQKMAVKLPEIPVPEAFTVGRTNFSDVYQDIRMEELVTEFSWFFFHVNGQEEDCRHEWLHSSIQNWEYSRDYRKFRDFI